MGEIPWAEIEGHLAAQKLVEDDVAPTVEILRSDIEISRELRSVMAAMLEGTGPTNTKLIVKSMSGPIAKSKFSRDYKIYEAVKAEVDNTGCSVKVACESLSGIEALGEESIRKAYQRANRAVEDYEEASNEARLSGG